MGFPHVSECPCFPTLSPALDAVSGAGFGHFDIYVMASHFNLHFLLTYDVAQFFTTVFLLLCFIWQVHENLCLKIE